MARVGRGRRARGGTAAVELALLSPLMVIMETGVIEVGMGFFESMQVQAAAEAGTLYAAKHGTSSLANIALAVTNATGTAGITASPAPSLFCGCPTTTGITAQGSDCTTKCSGNTLPGQYVQVNAMMTRTVIIAVPYLNLSLPATLSGVSVMRTQ